MDLYPYFCYITTLWETMTGLSIPTSLISRVKIYPESDIWINYTGKPKYYYSVFAHIHL